MKRIQKTDIISSYMPDRDRVVLLLNGKEISRAERRRYLRWSKKQHKG